MTTERQKNKFLILTPLKIELQSLIKAFGHFGFQPTDLNIEGKTFFQFKDLPFILTLGGHGKVNFALHTYDAILKLKTKNQINGVFCVGAAGSLSPDLKIADLAVGIKSVEHDYKTKFIKTALPCFEGHPDLIDLFDDELNPKLKLISNTIKKAVIASGDEDIDSSLRAHKIVSLTDAQAVAWEGIGGAKACKMLNTPYLELRGITDLCDSISTIGFKTNVDKIMHSWVEVFLNLKLA